MSFNTPWNNDATAFPVSSGFDGYRTITTPPPEQLRWIVTGVVVLLVVLTVLHTFTTTTLRTPPESHDKQSALTGRTATMTTVSASTTDDAPPSSPRTSTASIVDGSAVGTAKPPPAGAPPLSRSVLMWGDTPTSSHVGGGATSTLPLQQDGFDDAEIMIDDDEPSVTQHHSNTTRRRGTSTLLTSTDTASSLWWNQHPKSKTHQGELLQQSVLSAPLPEQPQQQLFRQQTRAVLSEAAAGSMLFAAEERQEDLHQDEEIGEVFDDPEDFIIRNPSSVPSLLRHRHPHQQQYYDDDDDIDTVILSSAASVMPPLSPDAVSPDDAADAHDTGRLVHYPKLFRMQQQQQPLDKGNNNSSLLDHWLEIAQPTFEHRTIVSLVGPSLLGQTLEPCLRLVLAAWISWWLSSPAAGMAFLLAYFLLYNVVTHDVVQAITDVESNLVKDSILLVGGDDGLLFAGQSIQLAVWLQGITSLGLLGFVVFATKGGLVAPAVEWCLAGTATTAEVEATYRQIAYLAGAYANVIVFDVWMRNVSKTLFLPLHMMHQGQCEYVVDASATVVTCVAVAVVSRVVSDGEQLVWVGWAQVAIGIVALGCKLAFVKTCELSAPYEKGFVASVTIFNPKAVFAFVSQATPLFIGSLLERREWDLFVVLVRFLGGAEVVAWVLMGIVWDICTSAAEALGEAASARISFYLVSGFPVEASLLAKKVVLFAIVVSLAFASGFLLLEPLIALVLSPDATVEWLVVQLVGVFVLANAAMVFALLFRNLLGAMGQFAKATALLLGTRWLITLPLTAVSIFAFKYDLRAVVGSIALGYGIATCLSGLALDWRRASWEMQHQAEINAHVDENDRNGEKQTVDHQSRFYDDGSFYSVSDVDTWEEDHKEIADSVTMGTTVLSSQSTERMIF